MIPFAAIAAGIYALDLLTKIAVRRGLPLGAEIKLLPFFSLVHIQNTGIAFGMFQEKNFVFLIMGLFIMAAMTWVGLRLLKQDRTGALIIAVVLGGALGNLTDRFFHGRVTDFLDFYVGDHHWPAFNVADTAICVGAALLLLREFVCTRSSSSSAH